MIRVPNSSPAAHELHELGPGHRVLAFMAFGQAASSPCGRDRSPNPKLVKHPARNTGVVFDFGRERKLARAEACY